MAHDPPLRLPSGVTEANVSGKLDGVLVKVMPGGRTTMRGGVGKKPAGKSLALASGGKKHSPSPGAKRLQSYVKSLTADRKAFAPSASANWPYSILWATSTIRKTATDSAEEAFFDSFRRLFCASGGACVARSLCAGAAVGCAARERGGHCVGSAGSTADVAAVSRIGCVGRADVEGSLPADRGHRACSPGRCGLRRRNGDGQEWSRNGGGQAAVQRPSWEGRELREPCGSGVFDTGV